MINKFKKIQKIINSHNNNHYFNHNKTYSNLINRLFYNNLQIYFLRKIQINQKNNPLSNKPQICLILILM